MVETLKNNDLLLDVCPWWFLGTDDGSLAGTSPLWSNDFMGTDMVVLVGLHNMVHDYIVEDVGQYSYNNAIAYLPIQSPSFPWIPGSAALRQAHSFDQLGCGGKFKEQIFVT